MPNKGILPPRASIIKENSQKGPMIQVINSHNLKRNDVVIKSILRSMKRYYKNKYIEFIQPRKSSIESETYFQESQKSVKGSSLLYKIEAVDRIHGDLLKNTKTAVHNLGLLGKTINMEFYFMCLALPSECLRLLQDLKAKIKGHTSILNQTIVMVKLIDGVMNRFSKKVFKTFMEIAEISIMVEHFLRKNEDQLERIEGFES